MANGQQIAEQNVQAFLSWSTTKTDDDFREYVFRGQLKRAEIASECGFGKSALTQNPVIRDSLKALEDGLRERGVLPPLKTVAHDSKGRTPLPLRDRDATKRSRDSQRLNSLEQENAALRAKLAAAEATLEKHQYLTEFLEETGRLPR